MKTAVSRQRKFTRSDLESCPDCGHETESIPGTERVLCPPCGREFLVRDRLLVRRLTEDERAWVAENMGIAGKVARKAKGHRIGFPDALEAAYHGLCKAATNYDAGKSGRTTHAYWTCWHSVGDAIRARSGYRRHGKRCFAPTNFTDFFKEGSVPIDPEDYRESGRPYDDEMSSIESALGKIDGRHANVIRMTLDGHSVADIARILKVSNKRINQIHLKAHAMIRRVLGVSHDRND